METNNNSTPIPPEEESPVEVGVAAGHSLPVDQKIPAAPKNASSKKNMTGILVGIIIVLLLMTGSLAYFIFSQGRRGGDQYVPSPNGAPPGSGQEQAISPSPAAAEPVEEIITENAFIDEKKVYTVTLATEVDPRPDSMEITKIIMEAVGLEAPGDPDYKHSVNLSFKRETDEKHPYDDVFNYQYVLLVDANLKDDSYTNNSVIIDIKRGNDSLIPYLKNSKYCSNNDDCVIRGNFCSVGAYNRYQAFVPVFGCGVQEYEHFEIEQNPFYLAEEGKICKDYEVKYESASCINNKCVASEPEIVCPSE